jgi:hypothetical protein
LLVDSESFELAKGFAKMAFLVLNLF